MRILFCFALLFCAVNLRAQDAPTAANPQALFSFEQSKQEINCFQQFNDTAAGVNAVNAFLLAKMTELMYLERIDYQMRYLHNHCEPVDSIPSSEWLKENCLVTDENFEMVFQQRFQHYFGHNKNVEFKYIQKIHTENAKFLGIPYTKGLDPELMIISTDELILILYRGTDDVGKSRWAEWLGTDFRINQMNAGGALVGTHLHTGFWLSFDLIRDELMMTLADFGAANKKIWVAGHSLGAALSVVTGVYLKSSGLNVQNVYAYACPRTIGNRAFIKKANKLLPNRIQRFEYYHDPVNMLWAPGFKYHYVGQRHWYDEEKKGNYKMYQNAPERVFISGGLKKYPHIAADEKKEHRRIKREQMNGTKFIGMKMLHYHNPQWYVKAAYAQLTEEEKQQVPLVDDSYPYLYFFRDGTK